MNIAADATVSGGTVTNVQFFTNGVALGAVLTAPFSLTANNLAAGAYALSVVATAAGISDFHRGKRVGGQPGRSQFLWSRGQ